MFSNQSEYDLRVFLSSYSDALHCLKQSADKSTLRKNYENIANRLTIYVKQKKMFGEVNLSKSEEKDILAFQYTQQDIKMYKISYIFLKYLPDFDNFKGNYEQLQTILNNSFNSLSSDQHLYSQQQQKQQAQ
ncbi:unnamed protein product [Paramecium octaurelia]|uniref:Uncharacterized protein n=1 Tax=Paramecium octaurelia TaxID=43137 RepID=A0A8S1RWP0_PAROT|nr:unnamed protein product [Paramecium octaurelia]